MKVGYLPCSVCPYTDADMSVNIAIPVPTVSEEEYNERCLAQYLFALEAAGATGIVVRLDEPQDRVARMLASVSGILLPGSSFDVDPERYGEARIPECGPADAARTAVDELMLQDAFNLKKPILGICHGTQTLNVWRNGSLIQDLKTPVNHQPGREVVEAHVVKIAEGSRLSRLVPQGEPLEVQVNSSHHQAVRVAGDKLLVSAVSTEDGVIEAVELDAQDHFVVAVQWHPERTYAQSAVSRALFASFVEAAREWKTPSIGKSDSEA
jgi:putative glutamine amidotransferase